MSATFGVGADDWSIQACVFPQRQLLVDTAEGV